MGRSTRSLERKTREIFTGKHDNLHRGRVADLLRTRFAYR